MKTLRRHSISGVARQPPGHDGRPGISPVDIAEHNSRTTLKLLRRRGALTRQELSRELGLTEPAITGIVRRLALAGLVAESKRTTTAHYTAAEFSLRGEARYSLGARINKRDGEIVLMDFAGRVVRQKTVITPDEVVAAFADLRKTAGPDQLVGCGIATSPDAFITAEQMEAALAGTGEALFFLDDTEAAIEAEYALGIGNPEGGMVMIITDCSVRAGLLIGGRVFRGVHGRAGQIGDMRSGIDGASLNDVATLPSLDACSADKGRWVATAARHLHEAVLAISGFIAPGAILIGGSLPGDVLDAVVARMLQERNDKIRDLVIAPWIQQIRRATFPFAGVAIGAALRPLDAMALPDSRA
ncbi:transcriptional regulator [Rhizobium sp. R72]|uniref:winged helix-turn-helix transcriptional regulator n=1 Tax=unclassified Rhizobium TaxID=2613769 RepID=UPI000B52DC20|nr:MULTISPECIES: winged helix-turn-helix transcriptional regulator [unclassified Rhizobium]OWW04077.1 transcriptional regulator [Rhizobium sp. R72]OWW04280.1 transcriptional regulator [Rhizobium sp. R711]